MLQDFLKAFSLILCAEMGDKTQIIALTFATMYRMKDILCGVALGAGLNHAIAIALGVMLTKFISLDFLQLIAGVVFIIFAILSISCEEEEDESDSKKKLGPIFTVALAFFIGELGDKTQISALTLSLDSNYPLFILLGTTSGMIVTSLLGIIIGGKLGKKIPEFHLKVLAFVIFLVFGLEKLSSSKYLNSFGVYTIKVFDAVIIIFALYKLYKFYEFSKQEKVTLLQKKAEELHNLKSVVFEKMEKICLNGKECTSCIGEKCIVNFIESITKESSENNSKITDEKLKEIEFLVVSNLHKKEFVNEIADEIKLYVEKFPEEKENIYIKALEESIKKIISE
ncbi:MAG: TMEM165/GDT1 family protein [Fusobacteriaceae bacterium]